MLELNVWRSYTSTPPQQCLHGLITKFKASFVFHRVQENIEDCLFEKLLYFFFRVSGSVRNSETVVTRCSYKKYPVFINLIYFQEYQLIRSSSLMDSDAICVVLKWRVVAEWVNLFMSCVVFCVQFIAFGECWSIQGREQDEITEVSLRLYNMNT